LQLTQIALGTERSLIENLVGLLIVLVYDVDVRVKRSLGMRLGTLQDQMA
jgi:hypothetical protein